MNAVVEVVVKADGSWLRRVAKNTKACKEKYTKERENASWWEAEACIACTTRKSCGCEEFTGCWWTSSWVTVVPTGVPPVHDRGHGGRMVVFDGASIRISYIFRTPFFIFLRSYLEFSKK
jgi:hypothetical protein